MFLENAQTFEYMITDNNNVFVSEEYLRQLAVKEGWVEVDATGTDWDIVNMKAEDLGFQDLGIFTEQHTERGAVIYLIDYENIPKYMKHKYFPFYGISDAKLRDMVIDCFHIAPDFEFLDIYYYPMYMYDDLMDDFTPLEQAYMDRSNFDVRTDEYFILTGENNDVLIGLTNEEYTKHLREHAETIIDYYEKFVK